MHQTKHYEESTPIATDPHTLFAYVDDHAKFSSHMNKASWMMGGGSMRTILDEGKGQHVGSHIRLHGNVFGITMYVDEVVTEYIPPRRKLWKTVGTPRLIIIGQYQMGLEITPEKEGSRLTVFIDYAIPDSTSGRVLGYLFSSIYATWCVRQMIGSAQTYFSSHKTMKGGDAVV